MLFTNNIGVHFKGCGQAINVEVKTAAALYTKESAAVLLGEIWASKIYLGHTQRGLGSTLFQIEQSKAGTK